MTQRGRAGARPGNRRPGGRGRDAAEARTPAAPRIDLAAAKARVRAVIEPVVAAAGYDLEDVSLSRAGRRHVVRVLVDADGGINLDDVAVVSREISTRWTPPRSRAARCWPASTSSRSARPAWTGR